VYQRPHSSLVGYIGLNRIGHATLTPDRVSHGPGRGPVVVNQHHRGTGFSKAQRNAPPDAPPRAGDNSHLVVEADEIGKRCAISHEQVTSDPGRRDYRPPRPERALTTPNKLTTAKRGFPQRTAGTTPKMTTPRRLAGAS